MKNIIIATIKSWNIANAKRFSLHFEKQYNINLMTSKEELNFDNIKKIDPVYIFFPHWSWIIPDNIFENFDCIVFHMTDLPYGRGGSPLQNLIVNKVYKTKISAIKVCKEVDAGDIYLKRDFDISDGSAEEIFSRLSEIIFFDMIPFILNNSLQPIEQVGDVVCFARRKQEDSDLTKASLSSFQDFYDFIRMLDGEGYPSAFVELNGRKIIFKNIKKENEKLSGTFEIF